MLPKACDKRRRGGRARSSASPASGAKFVSKIYQSTRPRVPPARERGGKYFETILRILDPSTTHMHSGLTAAMEFTTWRTASIPCASRPVVETTHHCPVMLGAIWFAPERFRPQGGRTRGGTPPTTAAVPHSSSFQAPKVALQQCSVDPNDSSPPLGRCAQNLAIGTGVRGMTFFHSKSLDYARPAFLHQPFSETD